MNYPSMEEVEAASPVQLLRWYRFLPSPGANHVDKELVEFLPLLDREQDVLVRISKRLEEAGGITSALSKEVGWDCPS